MHKFLNLTLTVIFASFVIYLVAVWTGLDSFLFAWVLNFMLMMSLLAFTKTVQPTFKSTYYTIRKWEQEGRIYKLLGVNIFRKLLVWVGWEKLNKKTLPVKNSSESLMNLSYATRESEFGHLVIFFIVMIFTIFVAVKFGIVKSIWLLLLNILLNVYPVLVQRFNRPKFEKLLKMTFQDKSR
ncbi:glycosyl-4,4'-diaponeurosporenoate acyltransferase CrtO family protein [Lunatibacter salilacus]|uniref:glycosyl-4,4'-diaponeurosporenoate acyltransferase CrtO family protein n=1 Tax=Lunatibacter salilacus TaxID=2483804 RepID=UPI00131C61D0|nr:hypothetical protein [Lunatibacter salilacus]